MATTYPLFKLNAKITAAGITAPSYNDILSSLRASAQQIFGSDVYLEPDSQDGQLLAIIAQGLHNANQSAIAAYNSFSPATAQGAALSNVVKINHLQRLIATKSQVNVTVIGVAGTIVLNGKVADTASGNWILPPTFTIPSAGTITVSATAEKEGAVAAPINTVVRIVTPTAGWQSATNETAATLGQPVESDAELRLRQEISPAISAYTVLGSMTAALRSLPGVVYVRVYENDTGGEDANGLPRHSISPVVKGGVIADIASTIYKKKTPGAQTYGTTSYVLLDAIGSPRLISFFIPEEKPIKVELRLIVGAKYTTNTAMLIKTAVSNYINALAVGEDVIVTRLFLPALLGGSLDSIPYEIFSLKVALAAVTTPAIVSGGGALDSVIGSGTVTALTSTVIGDAALDNVLAGGTVVAPGVVVGTGIFGLADIIIEFNKKATCAIADVLIVVL